MPSTDPKPYFPLKNRVAGGEVEREMDHLIALTSGVPCALGEEALGHHFCERIVLDQRGILLQASPLPCGVGCGAADTVAPVVSGVVHSSRIGIDGFDRLF